MIKFTAKNFGCLKDFEIELQQLHALIGPNDSGKSTVLRALQCLGSRGGEVDWRMYLGGHESELFVRVGPLGYGMFLQANGNAGAVDATGRRAKITEIEKAPSSVRLNEPLLLRPDPDCMRQAVHLIPHDRPVRFFDERGTGLAAVYDALIGREVETYLKIATEVRRLFPEVQALQLQNVDQQRKALAIKLADGTTVPVNAVSEGLLYYLAFAVLPYVGGRRLVLIEEPENGLHPARIREVMNVLKEVSKTSQVVIATHSPLVINELEPDQVSIITRDPDTGSKATAMRDTKNFEQRSKVYALGELWLSYADGEMEKDLVKDGAA